MTDFTDEVELQDSNAPNLQPIDIVKKIYWFNDGKWAPPGLNPYTWTPPRNSYLMLIKGDDPEDDPYVNLFEILSSGDPLLATDQGLVVQKDITAGGFIGSNQGELWLAVDAMIRLMCQR